MLLGKPESKFEVYNDIDGELVNLFRVIKNRPAELLLELGLLPLNSRAEFNDWLHFHNGGNDPAIHLGTQEMILDGTLPKEWAEEMKATLRRRANYREVRQAAAFLMRVRNSYSSSGRSFACQPFNIRSLFDMIWEMSFRLANVLLQFWNVIIFVSDNRCTCRLQNNCAGFPRNHRHDPSRILS